MKELLTYLGKLICVAWIVDEMNRICRKLAGLKPEQGSFGAG
jgi:hypothetical protein